MAERKAVQIEKELENLTVQQYLSAKTKQTAESFGELTNKDIDAFVAKANAVKAQLQSELEQVEKELGKTKK